MTKYWIALTVAAIACLRPAPPSSPSPETTVDARRDDSAIDTYFGVEVPDPYHWLEDPDSPETRAWITAQNAQTDAWLAQVEARGPIGERLQAMWNHERFGVPRRQGAAGHILYEHNDGLQNQNELWILEGVEAEPRLLLDANTLSEDGTVSLTSWELSPDGRYLAYGTSDGGSDWNTVRVRDVASGEDLPDVVEWVKFSRPRWEHDSRGFYYSRFPAPVEGREEAALADMKVHFHALGTPQAEDPVVLYDPEHPRLGYDLQVSHDGAWQIVEVWQGASEQTRVWVRPSGGDAPWIKVHDDFDARYSFVDNVGSRFLFFTDHSAPRGRLIAVDVAVGEPVPGPEAWVTVIPESEDSLEGVSRVGDSLIARYLHSAHSKVRRFGLDGTDQGEVALPGLGTADGFGGSAERTDTFFTFSSFTSPPTVYRYDLERDEAVEFRSPEVDFDAAPYVTEQVFFASKDGTRVPMFVTRRRDAQPSGDHPVLLYGYGGFNIPIPPRFSVANAVWLEMGGLYVSANLRGGGEFGRDWHRAGTQLDKQNVFDDFIGAAEALVAQGWTRPDRIGIHGRSNGGLLVGATLLQRPDLFGAAVPAVGVLDMLKYHTWTIGWGWADDYGTVADSQEMFQALYAYSPVHNARPASYPPTLILTADHDDRVVPAHSFKFAAALQHAQSGPAPVLARIDTRAGHGAGKSVAMQIEERTDMLAFLAEALQVRPPSPAPE